MKLAFLFATLTILAACGPTEKPTEEPAPPATDSVMAPVATEPEILQDTVGLADSAFVNLAWFGGTFAYDMRYATDNNFMEQTVYPCAVCKTRYVVAKALLEVAETLKHQGLKLKFYDCYRPVSVQKILWEVYPNPNYVANPNTSGSVHNRGAAVDLTVVDAAGKELDMGTGYDDFSEQAHHSYTDLADTVLANRALLKSTMEAAGFAPIRTEWWHYNLITPSRFPLADEPLCEE